MRSPNNLSCLLFGIYFYMVFLHFNFCRGKTVSAVHLSRSCLKPSSPNRTVCSSCGRECSTIITGRPSRSSSCSSRFFFGFRQRTVSGSSPDSSATTASGFVKEHNLSVHLHKGDLFIGLMPLR